MHVLEIVAGILVDIVAFGGWIGCILWALTEKDEERHR